MTWIEVLFAMLALFDRLQILWYNFVNNGLIVTFDFLSFVVQLIYDSL